MSRQLPPFPHLEHLRRQAKSLLQALQQDNPLARLADAQHALAREYGFASWPKLKAHVEAASAGRRALAGKWIANIERSSRHPDNPFRRASLQLEVRGDLVTIVDVVHAADGREERTKNVLHADGRDYAQPHGFVVTASWQGDRTIAWEVRRNGGVEGRGRYEVSDDGSTLTLVANDQVFVFDRVTAVN
jgi:hypothetical protein